MGRERKRKQRNEVVIVNHVRGKENGKRGRQNGEERERRQNVGEEIRGSKRKYRHLCKRKFWVCERKGK